MRALSLVAGVLLILLGGFSLMGGSFSWTQDETVLDVGPVQATAETRRSAALPPLAAGGMILLGAGAVAYGVMGRK